MEEIVLIIGDSSDLYEFISKQVPILDDTWEASYVVSEVLGGTPVISGDLVKNEVIYNEDSLVGEDTRNSYKIFEPHETSPEFIEFNVDNIVDNICVVSGVIKRKEGTSTIVVQDKYAYITIKGVFVPHSRTERVKSDIDGNFSINFDLNNTIKTPQNSFFIFQLVPSKSEQLLERTYFLTIEIRQKNVSDEVMFRKEIMQVKLKMTKQGIL
jgi:hypothetical protein